jgi:hypothetical protein
LLFSKMRLRRALAYLAVVAVALMMAGFIGHGRLNARSYFEQNDTTVWYCAGQAVNAHANPYLVEPLRSCEIANEPDHDRKFPWVEPAPLPGYALAAFAGLAHLPFPLFRALWYYLLVAAVILTAVLLGRLAKRPVLLALLCLAVVDARVNLGYGELPPLIVAALVAAAVLGAQRRYVAAAVVGAVSMIEPHLGLPACLAMFVWWPQTRLPLAVVGAVLAGVSIAALGLPTNVEYFATLLPAHAASEIAAADQFSLTRVLHILGFADKTALTAGSISYLVMTALGVAIARRVSLATDSPALVVLLPPALALLGGPFVHDLQIAAAIPAAFIIAASARPPLALRAAALVAVVFPWHAWRIADSATQGGLLQMGAVVAAILVALGARSIPVRVVSACAGLLVVIGIAWGIECVPRHKVGPPTTITALAIAPGDLSSAAWSARVSRDRAYSTPDARDVTEKLPIWLGLLTLTGIGIALSRQATLRLQPTQTATLRVAPLLPRGRTHPLLFP